MSGRCRSSRIRSGWCRRASSSPIVACIAWISSTRRLALEDPFDQLEVREVVLDVEDLPSVARAGTPSPPGVGCRRLEPCWPAGRSASASSTLKVVPSPGPPVDPDRSAHCLDQSLGECQAKAGSFHLGPFGAQALERLEQPAELLGSCRGRCRRLYADASGGGDATSVDSPAGRLYLTAFESRLRSTCSRRWRSACTCPSRARPRCCCAHRRRARGPAAR